MIQPNLFIEVVKTHPNAKLPEYKTDGASGMDLSVCNFRYGFDSTVYTFSENLPYSIGKAGFTSSVAIIGTGIALRIPQGWEGQIRPRSSLTAKGIFCQIGTIDSDYCGEIKVVLQNLTSNFFEVRHGDRIAQIVFAPVGRVALQLVDQFSTQTARGVGGFGSTGK